ncbi:MAG: hypothetical protein GY733_09665 [bacterium]|nr:hypothetical protein [bacterium]
MALVGAAGRANAGAEADAKSAEETVAATTATSTPLDPWALSLSNTMHGSYYDNAGGGNAVHAYEDFHFYDELSLRAHRRLSAYETLQVEVGALGNDSDYRASRDTFLFERIRIAWEKGDTAVPFRADAGDFTGFVSYRTLQRTLKGAQIELQPRRAHALSGMPIDHSFVLFSGQGELAYRDLEDLGDDLFSGASWLVDLGADASLSLNAVNSYRAADSELGLRKRVQTVTTVAGEWDFPVASQQLTLEGELGYLTGDVQNTFAGQKRDVDAGGYFVQLSGKSRSPLDYRLRFEQADRNFAPAGALSSSARRSGEAHMGWRFSSGLQLRTRIQGFRDRLHSGDPLDTQTYGINLRGPVAAGVPVTGSIDFYYQSRDDRSNTTDSETLSFTSRLGAPLAAGWLGSLDLAIKDSRDKVTSTDSDLRQVQLGASRRFNRGPMQAHIAPAVLYRAIRGGVETDDVQPSMSLGMTLDRHSMDLRYSFLYQIAGGGGAVSNQSHTTGIRYAYQTGPHRLALEADHQLRDPSGSANSRGRRVALIYTFDFSKPAGQPLLSAETRRAIVAPEQPPPDEREPKLADLELGAAFVLAEGRLAAAGYTTSQEIDGAAVYEVGWLEEIDQRQRLVLEKQGRQLSRASLLVDFDDIGRPESIAQTYGRVERALLHRYGRPSRRLEEGELAGEDLAARIRSGDVVRTIEWDTPAGTLRAGLPRRLDGTVRLEVQLGSDFGPLRDTAWSVERIR